MYKSFTVLCGGILASAVMTLPAYAAGPPADGCPRSYALTPVGTLQDLAQQTPDSYFTDLDANDDGFLCNKFLPDASANVGIAHDNHVANH